MSVPRVVRRSVLILSGLLGGLLVLTLTALVFVMTPPGERWAKNFALSTINQQWRGHVTIGELNFSLDELELLEVSVQDPDGAEVLRAERLYVDVHLWDLIRQRIHIERFELANYRLHLQQHSDGDWNFERVLERVDPPRVEEDVGETLPVFVDELALTGGLVDARLAQGDQHLRIEALDWHGAVSYQEELLRGNLEVVGQVVEPRAEPLRLSAEADVRDERQRANAELSVGSVSAEGSMTLPQRLGRDTFQIRELDAAVKVLWPRFEATGYRYGPLALEAELKDGSLNVSQLSLNLPGMSVSKRSAREGVAFRVRANALEQTAKSITALLGIQLPAIAGTGRVDVRLRQPMNLKELSVDGGFEQLQFEALQASGVALSASVADVTQPTGGVLELTVDAIRGLDTGSADTGSADTGSADTGSADTGAHFEGLSLRLEQRERELGLALQLAAPYAVRVDLGGHLDPDQQRLTVQQLEVRYPDNHWRLHSRRARLSWGNEQWGLRDLDLVAAGQRVELDADYGPREQRAQLIISGLRLASIPDEWWPPPERADGVLNLRVQAQGPLDAPHVRFDFGASKLQWQGVSGLEVEVAGDYRDERVNARASGSGLGANIQARLDVPVRYPPHQGDLLELHASAKHLELERIWRAAADLAPEKIAESVEHLAGQMRLNVEVSGKWPKPSVRARAQLERGTLKWQGIERYRDVRLRLEASPERIHLRELSAAVQNGGVRVSGEATATGTTWDYGYEIDVDARRFPVPLDDPLLATAKLRLVGEASLERVTSKITIDGLELRRREPDGQPDRRQARVGVLGLQEQQAEVPRHD